MRDIIPPHDEDKTKLERMQERLYSPSKYVGLKDRKELKPKGHMANDSWDDGDLDTMISDYTPKKGINFFAIVTVIAFLFFAGALTYGFLNFWGGNTTISGDDVEINVIGPVSIGGGEELSLDILIQNNNPSVIQTVDLVIEYPDGTKKSEDLRTDLTRLREGLGDLESGAIIKRTYSAALFGEEGTEKAVSISVEYRLPNSNAIFEKKKVFDIALRSSPVRLIVKSVKEINTDQELVFDVELSSNSNQVLQNVMLEAIYPFGFKLESVSKANSSGNNKWVFDVLKPKEVQRFQIKGRLLGQDQEERVFKFSAGIRDEENPTELGISFITLPKSITISKPFFDIALSFDGNSDPVVVKPGNELIQAKVNYTNNTNSKISNARVLLTFNGDVLDKPSVVAGSGFYRSGDNTILWDSSTEPSLKEIPAGQSGVLTFTFRSKRLAFSNIVFKNPEITIKANAEGVRTSEREVQESIVSDTFKRVKFISSVGLNAVTSYGTSPFTDTGPLPPKVDSATTYTITLSLDNTSNDLKNGVVTASVPTYVRWNNLVSGDNESVSFDPISRILEWKLGDVAPFAGYTAPERKVSFQITLVPSVSQVGNSPSLLNNIRFSGTDTFVEKTIEVSKSSPTTSLEGSSDYNLNKVVD